MKVVLFCGGFGTRIRDYSETVPKPLIPLGNHPILWHVMDFYGRNGHTDFMLCLGYKAQSFRNFFAEQRNHYFGDCVISRHGTRIERLGADHDDWRIRLIDTGLSASIGARLAAARPFIGNDPMFLANYSDGLADVDLSAMIGTFAASDKLACFLAVRPPLSFHFASVGPAGRVSDIRSSDEMDIWINGGFFVFRREIFDYLDAGDLVPDVLQRLAHDDRLMAWRHTGFWRPMDTLKDHQVLEDMVQAGNTPWRVPRRAKTSSPRLESLFT